MWSATEGKRETNKVYNDLLEKIKLERADIGTSEDSSLTKTEMALQILGLTHNLDYKRILDAEEEDLKAVDTENKGICQAIFGEESREEKRSEWKKPWQEQKRGRRR